MSRRRVAAVAGIAALALAGCGSTVQVRSTSTVGQDGLGTTGTTGEGLSASTGSGTSGSPVGTTTGGTSGVSLGGSSTGGTSGTTTGAPLGTTGGSGSGATSGATSGGVKSRTPVKVGVVYASGVGAAAAAMGIPGLATGDNQAQAAAVIAWINVHGGLAGHPIKPVYWDIAKHQGSNAESSMQIACAGLTQDEHVQYVQSIAGIPQSGMACFAKAGVGVLDDETTLSDGDMAKYAAHLGTPGEIAPGRMTSLAVDDLWKRGWLTKASKVGVFSADSSGAHSVVDKFLTPALARYGLKAAKTVYVNPDGGDGGSAASSSAVLQFRSAGVDRVIPVQYSPLFFMATASSQGYHPAYALYSNLGPGALLESTVPKDQLKNAVGIGWQPYLDIGAGKMPGPVSPLETLCFEIMKKAGQASTSATTKGFQVQVCNVLFYLQDLATKRGDVPPDLLTSGRPLLGSTFVSSDTFRTDVTHRTDGVAGYRRLAYQEDCSCFQYVSGVLVAP